MPTDQPTRAQLDEAEAYLRSLDLKADEWLLGDNQQFYRVGEVTGRLFGMEAAAIRNAAERGDIPFSVLPNEKSGWRLDRQGLIWFIAQQRRAGERRASGAGM